MAGRVAKRIRFRDHVDPADQLALGAEMLRGRERGDIGQHALRDAEIIEQAEDLVIDRDGAGLVVDRRAGGRSPACGYAWLPSRLVATAPDGPKPTTTTL